MNDILSEEELTWRLMDSEFVLLDSVFVHENIVARSQNTLHSVKFSGAAQEMLNAQNALVDGDGRAVVHNAGKSFESVMKAALDKDHLSVQQLTDALLAEGSLTTCRRTSGEGSLSEWLARCLGCVIGSADTAKAERPSR